MWSFHGSSYDWGKDDVVKLTPAFFQPNVMGEMVKGGYGGGIPVVAFWTRQVGEAVGHVETIPISAAIPAKVGADGRVNTEVDFTANITLKPGETYSTPRSFVSVYAGDFYEPLRIWSSLLQKEGWELPKPSSEAYNVSWCGWEVAGFRWWLSGRARWARRSGTWRRFRFPRRFRQRWEPMDA